MLSSTKSCAFWPANGQWQSLTSPLPKPKKDYNVLPIKPANTNNFMQKGFHSVNNSFNTVNPYSSILPEVLCLSSASRRFDQTPSLLDPTNNKYSLPSGYNFDQNLKKNLNLDDNSKVPNNIKKPITDAKTKETYLDIIAKLVVGRNIDNVKKIYPKIRVVINNGTSLIGVHSLDRERINVEVKNDIVVKTLGFF